MSAATLELETEINLSGVLTYRVTTPHPVWDNQYTAEQLHQFPADWHYELIEGYLRPMMMPTGDMHGSCTALFTAFATLHILEHKAGDVFAAETGFLLSESPDTVKAPDFAYVAKGRMPTHTGKYPKVVPDLVLETRSPSDRKAGVEEKINEWLSFGTKYVLDLDPAKEILIVYRPNEAPLTLTKNDTFTAEGILPGFFLPLTKLFPAT